MLKRRYVPAAASGHFGQSGSTPLAIEEKAMRPFHVIVATIVALGFVCETAWAGYPYGGYGNNYSPNYGYQVNNYYAGGYAPQYGYGQSCYNGYESFPAAAARIRAEHSRARYFTHPLSLQNGPPVPYGYYGWNAGY
jgi:hypothetical protein